MTISYVSGASAEATTLTLPSHQKCDVIVMIAARTSSSTAPTVPSGWTVIGGRANTLGIVIAYKIANSSSEVSGTWTNAEALVCGVYRHDTNILTIGVYNTTGTTSTSITYPALTTTLGTAVNIMQSRNVDAFVLGIVVVNLNNSSGAGSAPTGMTNRVNLVGSGARQIALHDTNGNVASFASQIVTQGTSAFYTTFIVELHDSGVSKSSGMMAAIAWNGGYTS